MKFALLQALNLDDVGARRRLQRRDRGVEIAMLLLSLPALAAPWTRCLHDCSHAFGAPWARSKDR
jgi:hypothetical protein